MNADNIKKALVDVDGIIAHVRLLESNKATLTTSQMLHETGMILESLAGEPHTKVLPEVTAPTQETIVIFLEDTLKSIAKLRVYLKELSGEKNLDLITSVTLLHGVVNLIKAEAFFKAYYSDVKAQFDAMGEYNKILAEAKNIVIIVNEDMKAAMLKNYLEALWKDIWEKEVYIHNEHQKLVSEYMKAPNIHYESLHCEDCIKKFDTNETVFYTIGFKANDKLPVELQENAYVVQM